MPDQRTTRQEIEQARQHPLNKHCLELLKKEKAPVHDLMVGAPELLDWVLEKEILELLEPFREDLETVVRQLNLAKPQVATKYLTRPLEDADDMSPEIEAALQAKSVKQAAVDLFDKMHQILLDTRGDEYQPTIAPHLK